MQGAATGDRGGILRHIAAIALNLTAQVGQQRGIAALSQCDGASVSRDSPPPISTNANEMGNGARIRLMYAVLRVQTNIETGPQL
jgi:hypothetical protein